MHALQMIQNNLRSPRSFVIVFLAVVSILFSSLLSHAGYMIRNGWYSLDYRKEMQNDGSIAERTVINIHAVHDENGDVVTEDVITSISLTSPEGEFVELGPIRFNAKLNVIGFKYRNGDWGGNYEPYYGYNTTLVNHSPPHA